MPPKAQVANGAKGKKEEQKPKKISQQKEALNKAVNIADKLFKQHERERVRTENADGVNRQYATLDSVIERERLEADLEEYDKLVQSMAEREQLAYKEYDKHEAWWHVPDASRLPMVRSESSINTFLSVWRDEEREYDDHRPITTVFTKRSSIGCSMRNYRFLNGELGIAAAARRKMIDSEMKQCLDAYELTEAIHVERDRTLLQQRVDELRAFDESNGKVYEQVLRSLDFITCHSLLGYDVVLEGQDSEFLALNVPVKKPVIKYGLWVKVKETTRSFASLVFPNIGIHLEPRSSAMPKLPRALGLSKENVAIRVVQLGFNPHSHHGTEGRQYYALNCVLKVDLLSFTERPRHSGDWMLRSETKEAHVLQIVPYPSPNAENQEEDSTLRISFEVPNTIVMRQSTLLIGKWLDDTKEWDPCSYTTAAVAAPTSDGETSVSDSRRCFFNTNTFAAFAILQEKGFDVPYEQWRLQPVSFDQVMMVLEGRRRGEMSDREFRIIIEDAKCKLVSPDDPELETLREKWMHPATMVRMLSHAGFNFSLEDSDASFMNDIVPKTSALEKKVYADIAQFCLFHVVASSKHNKHGEDANLALFRISRRTLARDSTEPLDVPLDYDEEWYSMRYQTNSCSFAAFKDSEESPDLRVLEGHESHLNLYSLFMKEVNEEVRTRIEMDTNFLLQRCVYQLLSLTRPLTWG